MPAKAYRATQTFIAPDANGRRRIIQSGDVFAAGDPILEGRETLFELVDHAIERATAAPGEKRAVRKPQREGA